MPGNEEALVAGHRSERHVGPLAARIAQDLLTDPDVPPHIREPMFAAAVQAWARAEAVVRLLWAWLEERDVMAGLTASWCSRTASGGARPPPPSSCPTPGPSST